MFHHRCACSHGGAILILAISASKRICLTVERKKIALSELKRTGVAGIVEGRRK
jgi:hypothetical protein